MLHFTFYSWGQSKQSSLHMKNEQVYFMTTHSHQINPTNKSDNGGFDLLYKNTHIGYKCSLHDLFSRPDAFDSGNKK